MLPSASERVLCTDCCPCVLCMWLQFRPGGGPGGGRDGRDGGRSPTSGDNVSIRSGYSATTEDATLQEVYMGAVSAASCLGWRIRIVQDGKKRLVWGWRIREWVCAIAWVEDKGMEGQRLTWVEDKGVG